MYFGGADYFEAEDAAEYCGVSIQQWKKEVEPHIRPGVYRGRTIYRRDDLKEYIDRNTKWKGGPPPWEPNWEAMKPRSRSHPKRG